MLQSNLAGRGAPASDVIHTRRGERVTLRLVAPSDADDLQAYVRSLSFRSRHNRFLGAISELPKTLLDDFVAAGKDRFTVLATMEADGEEAIVGEARCAFHVDSRRLEFGLSVHDRWQGHGIGPALIENLERRAAALGAVSLFGDTLRTNEVMIAVAKASGFVLHQHPQDWTLVRFEKLVTPGTAARGCATLRLAAAR